MEKIDVYMNNWIKNAMLIEKNEDYIKAIEQLTEDIKKYSVDDVYNYLNNTENDASYMSILNVEIRLEYDKIISLSIKKYKDGIIQKEQLVAILNYANVNVNEVSEENLYELKQIFKGDEEKIYKILPANEQTDEILIKAILIYFKNFSPELIVKPWKDTKEQTITKLKLYCKHLEEAFQNNNDLWMSSIEIYTMLWDVTQNKNDVDLLNILMQLPNISSGYILNTTPPENKNVVKKLFQDYFSNETQEQIDKKLNRYYQLLKVNNDMWRTIDLDFLDDKFASLLSLEQITRIAADSYMVKEITKIPPYILKLLASRGKGFFENIKKIDDALWRYPNLEYIENFSMKKELLADQELLEKYINIILKDSENYFSIENIEDVRKYEEKKRKICFKLLKGEKTDTKLEEYDDVRNRFYISPENKKKFALLELLYGIDLESAENLVNKYGKCITEVKEENAEELAIKHYINTLESILKLDDRLIDKMLEDNEFVGFLKTVEPPEIASSVLLEEEIVQLYQREFNREIAKSSKPIKKSIIEYDGEKIEVEEYSPIDQDGNFVYTEFSIFARQEGAYTEWISPNNYIDYFNIQSAMSHGNCECFINQSQIAMARSNGGPKVGYLNAGKILLMAPWDISSAGENIRVSTINTKWSTARGIQFLTPKKLNNNTRHGHNESVSERIEEVDEENHIIKKRNPSLAIFIKEHYNEDIKDIEDIRQNEWEETKRLAQDLKIPIRRIDRQGFAIQEEMVIQHDLELLGGGRAELLSGIEDIERLTGKKCRNVDWSKKEELSRSELIREIIVRFENNAIGMIYASEKDNYFTEEKRQCVVNALMKTIEKGKETNIEQYYKDLETIEQIIQDEREKETTRGEICEKVYSVSSIYLELEQQVNKKLEEFGRKPYLNVDNSKELSEIIGFIYKSKIYDEDKQHSTDHISKTVLFADILAKNEGLSARDTTLLLIATALHECRYRGRRKK